MSLSPLLLITFPPLPSALLFPISFSGAVPAGVAHAMPQTGASTSEEVASVPLMTHAAVAGEVGMVVESSVASGDACFGISVCVAGALTDVTAECTILA